MKLLTFIYYPAGQFYHGVGFEVAELHPDEADGKFDAIMYVKGQTLNVTRSGYFIKAEHTQEMQD